MKLDGTPPPHRRRTARHLRPARRCRLIGAHVAPPARRCHGLTPSARGAPAALARSRARRLAVRRRRRRARIRARQRASRQLCTNSAPIHAHPGRPAPARPYVRPRARHLAPGRSSRRGRGHRPRGRGPGAAGGPLHRPGRAMAAAGSRRGGAPVRLHARRAVRGAARTAAPTSRRGPGTPVRAACAGTRRARRARSPGRGGVVSVRCGARRVSYLPLARDRASAPARRSARARRIGTVAAGHGGLHLGVRRESDRVRLRGSARAARLRRRPPGSRRRRGRASARRAPRPSRAAAPRAGRSSGCRPRPPLVPRPRRASARRGAAPAPAPLAGRAPGRRSRRGRSGLGLALAARRRGRRLGHAIARRRRRRAVARDRRSPTRPGHRDRSASNARPAPVRARHRRPPAPAASLCRPTWPSTSRRPSTT